MGWLWKHTVSLRVHVWQLARPPGFRADLARLLGWRFGRFRNGQHRIAREVSVGGPLDRLGRLREGAISIPLVDAPRHAAAKARVVHEGVEDATRLRKRKPANLNVDRMSFQINSSIFAGVQRHVHQFHRHVQNSSATLRLCQTVIICVMMFVMFTTSF